VTEEVPPLPADLTDAEHARLLTPPFIRRRANQLLDPVVIAKADRIAELRQDDKPISLEELETARNRSLRQAIRRMPEMKPHEIVDLVEVLDGEIASRRVSGGESPEKAQATRAEMIAAVQGAKNSEVQK
jgi:hypothetical protein